MKTVILKVGGMSCSACQNRVEKYLNKQDGVKANVNLVMAQALIEYDEEKVTIEDLERFIKESGYESLGLYEEKKEGKEKKQTHLISMGILIIIMMILSMSHIYLKEQIKGILLFILTLPFLYFGYDILKSGIKKLLKRSPNMDSLVAVGVISSFLYSTINLVLLFLNHKSYPFYFEGCAMILFLIQVGRLLDKKSKEKTTEAIQELVQITPESALLTKNGEKEVTIDEVKKKDILICKPGMKIAVDGVIVKGEAHLEESFITGESIPKKKTVKDKVIAGSINLDGYLEYEAERIGPDSTISEIVRLVISATGSKTKTERLADKVSGVFVPAIFLIAFITLFWYLILGNPPQEAITSFVTVLVVACPCSLGLAIPLAIVVSVGRNAKEGILIKSSEILERADQIDTIVFDKTGTLTYGKLKIANIENNSQYADLELLERIAALESKSSHPIAKAFQEYQKENIDVEKIKNIPGMGIVGEIEKKEFFIGNEKLLKEKKCKNTYLKESKKLEKEGNTLLFVGEGKKCIALIGVKDIVRENAKEVIRILYKKKKDILILSGDRKETTKEIAEELGIKEVYAELLPKEKEQKLRELMKDHKVMMVGDGINDAPSLACSDIGVSMNGGTDIAADSSDVILVQDDLSKIISLIENSKKTKRIMKQNLFWAFIYNVCMIPIAIGILKPFHIEMNPMLASFAMTCSSLCVIMNSLRLRKEK